MRIINRQKALVVLLLLAASPPAVAQECRSIGDSLSRLRCYDAQFPPNADSQSKPLEEPLIANAKIATRKLLREPKSAVFEELKISRDAAGNSAICGTVNSRNATGGMTGPKLFVFDGKLARILVTGAAADNGTSFDGMLLGILLGETLKVYEQFCKSPKQRHIMH